MKTAISLPDSVFEDAEQFARNVQQSRSQLYVAAIKEYLARHAADNITNTMNSVCDSLEEQDTEFANAAALKILSSEPW
jgi:metal-responsive CopG/Arc/MetJ family transcriptional regulator